MTKAYLLFALAGLMTMASCTKSGTCTCTSKGQTISSTSYSGSAYDAAKVACPGTSTSSSMTCLWSDN